MYKVESVIFLDFDGPLFSTRASLLEENNNKDVRKICNQLNLHPSVTYWKMDPVAVALLNKITKMYKVKFVISSSWSNPILHSKQDILNLLEINGLKFVLHDNWCTKKVGAHRIEEISNWLIENPQIQKYVVIDDIKSAPEMNIRENFNGFKLKPEFVFLVSYDDGILMNDFRGIMQVLNLKPEDSIT